MRKTDQCETSIVVGDTKVSKRRLSAEVAMATENVPVRNTVEKSLRDETHYYLPILPALCFELARD